MRKQPVGYFIDPATKEVVAILPRNRESAEEARKRVSSAHNVEAASITDKIPKAEGNPGLESIAVDVPDRPAGSRPSFKKREETNPSDSVSRFQNRLREADESSKAPAPPVQDQLMKPVGGSLLSVEKKLETRSTDGKA